MAKQITGRMAFDYIANRGRICPHCGSDRLTTGSRGGEPLGTGFQIVNCGNCRQSWRNRYALTAVSYIDGDGDECLVTPVRDDEFKPKPATTAATAVKPIIIIDHTAKGARWFASDAVDIIDIDFEHLRDVLDEDDIEASSLEDVRKDVVSAIRALVAIETEDVAFLGMRDRYLEDLVKILKETTATKREIQLSTKPGVPNGPEEEA